MALGLDHQSSNTWNGLPNLIANPFLIEAEMMGIYHPHMDQAIETTRRWKIQPSTQETNATLLHQTQS
jgi:hypothetical protein